MRKQILTVVVCLALSTTAAFAKCNCANGASKTLVKPAPAAESMKPSDDANKPCFNESMRKKFEAKMEKDRQELYSKLELTKCQKDKADALHKSTKAGMEPLMAKFHDEKVKLHELKAQNACPDKIAAQKAKVKDAKTAVKNYMEKSKKDFEAILTDCQLSKLKALKAERKAAMKNCKCKGKCHCHHHGLDEDDIAPFSPEAEQPQPQAPAKACPCKK